MKRLASCDDSLGALISICPNSSEMDDERAQGSHQIPGNPNPYSSREFQAMLEGLEEEESSCKKRRLSVDQVKALEKNFEVENKLEPDRKFKLAQELGLQPRQVAVWFQNRRARWKTKQLERDFSLLKASHDALTHKFQSLQKENEQVINQIEEIKAKLNEEGSMIGVKGEPILSEEGCKVMEASKEGSLVKRAAISGDFMKDGSSDSDSSAILNEDNVSVTELLVISNGDIGVNEMPQFVKIEEHDFFGEKESCSTLFTDDQAPCLNWYCSDSWN